MFGTRQCGMKYLSGCCEKNRYFVFEKDTSKTRHLFLFNHPCLGLLILGKYSFWIQHFTAFRLGPCQQEKSSRHVVSMFAAFKPASNDMCPLYEHLITSLLNKQHYGGSNDYFTRYFHIFPTSCPENVGSHSQDITVRWDDHDLGLMSESSWAEMHLACIICASGC